MNEYILPFTRGSVLLFLFIVSWLNSAMANDDGLTPNLFFTPTFYRGINLNGAALSIDGNSWVASSGAANFTYIGSTFANQNVTLNPSTDATRATMIRSSIWGNNVTLNLTSVPNGYYSIYLYVWEDNSPATFSISIEGATAQTNYNSGSAGTWAKLGPFTRNITDGAINITTTGGAANLSGVEVWTANSPPVVASAIPNHTAIVGELFTYNVPTNTFSDPDAGATLTYSAGLSNGNPLPGWLSFNATTRNFSGTPASGNMGSIDVRVTATDEVGEEVIDIFQLTVAAGFYRAININGAAQTIDGNSWEASTGNATFNFSQTNGGTFGNQSVNLNPSTDASRATMIRSSVYGSTVNVNVTSVPNGIYDVSIYVWEDDAQQTYSLSVEGTTAQSNISLAPGAWVKLGPFRRTITDGAINISTVGGHANLSGVDIRRAGTGEVLVNQVNVSPSAVTLAAGQAVRLDKAISPANATNQNVNWSSNNNTVATVNANGLVRAVTPGTAIITAASVEGGRTAISTITVRSAGSNVLANPEFDSGMSQWLVGDWTGIPANTLQVVQGAGLSGTNALHVNVNNNNNGGWMLQVRSIFGFRLEVGRTYRVSFLAKAESNRQLTATLHGEGSNSEYWTANQSLTTTVQRFSYQYTPAAGQTGLASEAAFSIMFHLAKGVISDVWLDNVRVEDITGINAVTNLALSPATLSLNISATSQLTQTFTPSNATNQEVKWSSSNTSVAMVNSNGLVTAVTQGSAIISAYSTNGGFTATSEVNVTSIGQIPDAIEIAAIKDLFFSLNGPNSDHGLGWPTTEQEWSNIQTLDQLINFSETMQDGYVVVNSGDVTELWLQGENFIGTIPGSIGNLSKLEHVQIANNNISDIDNLTALPNLEVLIAYDIALTGSLPNFGSQTQLSILDLSENPNLSPSTIPQWIQSMTGLTELYLNNVNFTGEVPSWLNQMNSLSTLQLMENHLEGQIPDWIFENGWEDVRLGYNNFHGNLPSIPQNNTLRFLNLSFNKLSGSLPSTIENLEKINVFDVSDNELTGSLPTNISTFTPNFGGTYIYLENNKITSIPTAFWTNFNSPSTTIILDHNEITDIGTVPSTLTSFGHISLRENFLSYKDLESAFAYYNSDLLMSFSPQRFPGNINVSNGHPLEIIFELPSSSVIVQWEKLMAGSWQSVEGLDESTDLNVFKRNSAALSDAGTYRFKVINGPNGANPFVVTEPIEVTIEEVTQSSIFDDFAFQYKYDARKRMSHKKVPGADWVYMVYDNRDRLVMTQDGVQRDKQPREWTFTKYDELNRPILTGIFKDTENREQDVMQDDVNDFYDAAADNADEWFEVRQNSTLLGYTNNSFPKVSNEADYLTATYYDDYSILPSIGSAAADYEYDNNELPAAGSDEGQRAEEFGRVQGQVTASRIKNLDTNEFLWSVNYYDDRYRAIQVIAQNTKGGLDKITNVYDFVGKVLRTKTDHTISGENAIATTRKMLYDHAGRLTQTEHQTTLAEHQTGTSKPVTLTKNEYNELGQLVTKKLHKELSEPEYKQHIDYRYNIRGWLTRINNADLNEVTDAGPKDYYGMELGYNTTLDIGTMPQYNGNISAVKWSSNQGLGSGNVFGIFEPTQRGYAFIYDPMNRLASATHKENLVDWNTSVAYHEDGLEYDLNGNILKLHRKGKAGLNMDQMKYDYQGNGNQLRKVDDFGSTTEGFKDRNLSGDDYLYDDNGNMKLDKNKSIASIEYNYLNLPAKVIKTDGQYVKYIYNAAGGKLSQEVYSPSNVLKKKTDYLGEFFYENDTLKFINHEEGRIVMTGTAPEYQYTLKDHLGNMRITFTAKHDVEEFTATMDISKQENEEDNFGAYKSYTMDVLDPSPQENGEDKILVLNGSALNGSNNGQVGLTKSFAVLPGDVVTASVNAKYIEGGESADFTEFAASLMQAFGVSPSKPFEGLASFEALNNFLGVMQGIREEDDELPKGFLNILVFDKSYELVDAAFAQVGESTMLAESVEIGQPGYVYVFLSNDGVDQMQIGFDNYSLTHEHSDVIQQDDYYPFGLTFNSYQRENTVEQKNLYNGKEVQDELDLGWLDFGWRMYQPDIGRWGSVDALADSSITMTPYHYVANNPLLFIDPDGNDWFVNKNNGATVFIKGVSEFNYKHLEKHLGKELTAKISEGMGADAWENFGSDEMFDTKDNKLSDKGLIAMDPSSSEKFMNKNGYEKAADQRVTEFDEWQVALDGPMDHSATRNFYKTIETSKITYKKPEEFGKTRLTDTYSRHFGGTLKISSYRQIIRYTEMSSKGVSVSPQSDVSFKDFLSIGKDFRKLFKSLRK